MIPSALPRTPVQKGTYRSRMRKLFLELLMGRVVSGRSYDKLLHEPPNQAIKRHRQDEPKLRALYDADFFLAIYPA